MTTSIYGQGSNTLYLTDGTSAYELTIDNNGNMTIDGQPALVYSINVMSMPATLGGSFAILGQSIFMSTAYPNAANLQVSYYVDAAKDVTLEAYDLVNATTLGTQNTTAAGIHTLSFTKPVSDTVIQFRAKSTAGTPPNINTAVFSFSF